MHGYGQNRWCRSTDPVEHPELGLITGKLTTVAQSTPYHTNRQLVLETALQHKAGKTSVYRYPDGSKPFRKTIFYARHREKAWYEILKRQWIPLSGVRNTEALPDGRSKITETLATFEKWYKSQ
jgi:hypothetical protein